MRKPFVIKPNLVGSGPTTLYEVYENLGFFAGLTWRPWFTSFNLDEARRYADEANETVRSCPRFELDGPYWCEVSPRSQSFGRQYNVMQPDGFFGLSSKLARAAFSRDEAEKWAMRAALQRAEAEWG